jgi:hypothetical protein
MGTRMGCTLLIPWLTQNGDRKEAYKKMLQSPVNQ